MDDSAPVPAREPARIPLLAVAMVLVSVGVYWFVGHLPWLLVGTDQEPFVYFWLPVPLVAGQLAELVAYTVIGAVTAMLLPLLFPAVPRVPAVLMTGLAVVATALAAASVARSTLSDHADSFASDPRVLDGLFAGVLLLVLVCVVVGGLASWQIGFLPVAVALVVTQLASWVARLELPRPDLVTELTTVVLLAAAFVVSVRRSVLWAATWPVALLVVWLGAPAAAAMTTVAGRLRPGQNLDDSLGDVYRNGLEVFGAALWDSPRTWWPWLVALLIGVVWLVAQQLRSRSAR